LNKKAPRKKEKEKKRNRKQETNINEIHRQIEEKHR
jgi:hypothetical protein